jgi:hypothetical protein
VDVRTKPERQIVSGEGLSITPETRTLPERDKRCTV